MDHDIITVAGHIFAAQPFSRLIGARLTHVSAGRTIIELPLRDELCQQHGMAHGGVLSYLADNAITFAGGVALVSDAVTSEFKINYLRPAIGPLLRAIAEPVSLSGRQAVCQCRILSVEGDREELAALAQGTVVKVSART